MSFWLGIRIFGGFRIFRNIEVLVLVLLDVLGCFEYFFSLGFMGSFVCLFVVFMSR